MGQKPATPVWVHDIATAFGLLTRVPVALDPDVAMARSAVSAWAYPVVGLILGGLGLLLFTLCQVIGLPPLVALIFMLAFNVVVTGAMHEDGLADAVDGLWGGWTIERRLEIMKDSRIGVYGVCALLLAFLIKVAALAELALTPLFALAVVGAAGLSRAAMVTLMHHLPNARGRGLSRSVGHVPVKSMWFALAIAISATLLFGLLVGHPAAAILMVISVTIAAALCGMIARRKINGQTGDILGATQQVCEIVALVVASAFAY
ncbi:adenosylcobinamide-GDP ribazoletransferase [Cognatiyoonia koreensis]|nr:adenosylcobinamide-GDP ribazoletransferase [Cognatiyoonia koreensis]